jgi:hypothetical protein
MKGRRPTPGSQIAKDERDLFERYDEKTGQREVPRVHP